MQFHLWTNDLFKKFDAKHKALESLQEIEIIYDKNKLNEVDYKSF